MELEDLLKQNSIYFYKNEEKRFNINNKYSSFVFDLVLNFHVIDYHNDEKVIIYNQLDYDDVLHLLSFETSNIIKARLLNLLIDTRKDNIIDNATNTIEFYMKAIDDDEDYEYRCSCLNKVISLSKKYKVDKTDFIVANIKKLLPIQRIDNNAFDFHLLKTAYEYQIVNCDEILISCRNKLEESVKANGYLFDAYFELSLKILNDMNKTHPIKEIQKKKNDLYEFKAKIYEIMGDNDDVTMRKSHYYSISLESYKLAKVDMHRSDVNNVRRKMDENQRKSLDGMSHISEKIDLTSIFAEIKNKIDSVSNGELIYVLIYFGGIQNKKEQIESVKNRFKSFPLLALFPTAVVNSDGKTVSKLRGINLGKDCEENDQIILEHAYDSIRLNSQILGQIISIIINMIKEKGINIENDIRSIVDKSYIVKKTRKNIVIKGLIYGFNLDLESSLSILIPQFENALRELAYVCGETKYKLDSNSTESVNGLEYYFKNNGIMSNTIDENIFFTIDSVFVNEYGLNYRNSFAHGCIESFNDYTSLYVWWLILYTITVYS